MMSQAIAEVGGPSQYSVPDVHFVDSKEKWRARKNYCEWEKKI